MGNAGKMFGFAALGVVVMQVLPVDRSGSPADGPLEVGDPVVADLMDRACVDCHTDHTTWPWYAKVAPVSWWITGHVQEGREHFDLSVWEGQSARSKDHKLEEMVEQIEEGEMPTAGYTWMHPEARLSDEERRTLVEWANGRRAELGVESSEGPGERGEAGEVGGQDDDDDDGEAAGHDDDDDGEGRSG